MKRDIVVTAAAAVLCFVSSQLAAQDIAWQQISRQESGIRALAVSEEEGVLYFSSGNSVFSGKPGLKEWRPVLRAGGVAQSVNALAFDCQDEDIIYAATGAGLFRSANKGGNWKRVFKAKSAPESGATAVAASAEIIYLGTGEGLFISRDKGRNWQRPRGALGAGRILAIACCGVIGADIYIACPEGVFRGSFGGEGWEKVFRGEAAQEEDAINTEEDSARDEEEEAGYRGIRHIAVGRQQNGAVYLASSSGVFRSKDKGRSWQRLGDYGFLGNSARFLMVSENNSLYALNRSGLFEYKQERWHELSLGLPAGDIFVLAQDRNGNLYAACDKGLFKGVAGTYRVGRPQSRLEAYMRGQPGIKEIQQAAIGYAEVEPQKIIQWRKQAARRALLPRLSIGMDFDRNRTVSKNIWGIYSSYSNGNITAPGRYYSGPDDITRYDQSNWDISLSWDLGDLIWSSAQTSIDVRSRLMAQLRDDILDEVNKLYFERIRLLAELDGLAIEDAKKRFEKELKVQELTAGLDALTGGYFSDELKRF